MGTLYYGFFRLKSKNSRWLVLRLAPAKFNKTKKQSTQNPEPRRGLSLELINRLCCGKYGQNTAKSIEIKIELKQKRAQENFLNFSQGFLFWWKLTTFHQTTQVFILPLQLWFTTHCGCYSYRFETKQNTPEYWRTSMQSGICSARYLRRYHHTYLLSVWRKNGG